MKKILLFISIIGILMISGCNTVKQSPTDNKSIQNTQNIVNIKNFAFEPANIAITKGQTVTWINSDSVEHTVTSVTGEFNSGSLKPGQKYSYKFGIDGPYEYYCTTHSTMSHGKITVTG